MQAESSSGQPPERARDRSLPRGAQGGKRSSGDYNDPVAQDGARVGQPRHREADAPPHMPGPAPLPGDTPEV